MKRALQLGALLAVAAAAFFLIRAMFPSDADVIRANLEEMVQEASFTGQEAPLATVSKAARLAGYFTEDAEVRVRPWGARQVSVDGRTEIRDAIIGARNVVTSLSIDLDRVEVAVAGDRSSAQATLAITVRSSLQDEPWHQQLIVDLRRVDRDWLIGRVTNVELIRQ